jgi:hypothetical protein
MSLALRDAFHLRGMDAVELALVMALLDVEPPGEGQQIPHLLARIGQFALYVADDPAEDGPESARASTRPSALFSVGVATLLGEQALANPHV